MRRRDIIALFAGTVIARPLTGHAKQANKIPRVGVLWHAGSPEEEGSYFRSVVEGFRSLGYVDGQSIILEHRFANEQYERFDKLAAELVGMNIDAIVAVTPPAALAAQRATTTIPIVFVLIPDPVRLKLVDQINRPGRNATGLSQMMHELQAKRLQLLKEAAPDISHLALLVNPANGDIHRFYVKEMQAAQADLGVTSTAIELSKADEVESVFAQITRPTFDGVVLFSDGLHYVLRHQIAKLLLERRMPSMWFSKGGAMEFGNLMSYGPDLDDLFKHSTQYVDKILRGTNPSDIPVEFPTRYPLILNFKTAKAIGLTLPPSLLARADEVIE